MPTCTWGQEEVSEQDDNGEVEVLVAAGGRYMTPPHLATIAQTQADLQMHMQGHQVAVAVVAPAPPVEGGQQVAASRSKPAKLERPRAELDMTEPEWSLFFAEWKRYCRSCKLEDPQEKVDQLWGCLSAALKRAAAGDGLESVTDDTAFLSSIK